MKVGDTLKTKGYITCYHFVAGKGASKLEQLLGFKADRLGLGWALLELIKMPKPSDFQFRGYSQMSGGIPKGHLKNPLDKKTAEKWLTAEESLTKDGFDVVKLKEAIIKNTFTLSGNKRLVKIIPNKKPSGSKDYPPGLGIPQWELIKPLAFKVVSVMLPGEQKWQ